MADSKITALTALTAADPVNDMFPVVDVSDTSMAASGTTKKISVNNILGASGTATLASATITGAATVGTTLGVTGNATLSGDLTVRTSKLFVNATGVGIGNAGPLSVLTVSSQTDARLSVRTTDTIFGTVVGGSGFDSLNDAGNTLVPFGCRASTISFGSSGGGIGLQLDASNNVNVPLGNVVMGTSGKGIDFSATAGTGTSELLNDYEEGTFTSTIVGSTTAGIGVYSEQVGRYTKVGRLVTVDITVTWSAHTGTGNMRIGGLPFTSNSTSQASGSIGVLSNIALTAGYVATAYNYPSTALIFLLQYATGGSLIDVPIDTAGSITVSMTYSV